MTCYPYPVETVGHLVRNASLLALADAILHAHKVGNMVLRDRLTDRWLLAVRLGVGTAPGIASLEHVA